MLKSASKERFWKKVSKTKSCWLWTGSNKKAGYGQVTINRVSLLAHRVSYEMATRTNIPKGLCVLHKCDNKICVNPAHLFLGTKAENNTDRNRKGRSNPITGEAHHNIKLKDKDILRIKELGSSGRVTQRSIAKKYKISFQHVSDVLKGKRRKYL